VRAGADAPVSGSTGGDADAARCSPDGKCDVKRRREIAGEGFLGRCRDEARSTRARDPPACDGRPDVVGNIEHGIAVGPDRMRADTNWRSSRAVESSLVVQAPADDGPYKGRSRGKRIGGGVGPAARRR
jgi:hypothetical protein